MREAQSMAKYILRKYKEAAKKIRHQVGLG